MVCGVCGLLVSSASSEMCERLHIAFVQFNGSFLFRTHCALHRNPGKFYGGNLNVSHMGIYSSNEQFLNISFQETTIVRRIQVPGIRLRAMFVVSSMCE